MPVDPEYVSRDTTNLGLPIYKPGSPNWDDAIAEALDMIDAESVNWASGGQSIALLDGDSNFAASGSIPVDDTFHSVGPTGSAANVIWGALDSLPAGVSHLIANVSIEVKGWGLTGNYALNGYMSARKIGSLISSALCQKHSIEDVAYSTSNASGLYILKRSSPNLAIIEVDANKMFEVSMKKDITCSAGSPSSYFNCVLKLLGHIE